MGIYKGILPKGFIIDEKYSILLFIKQSGNTETYRVKGVDGILYFLKLFNLNSLHQSDSESDHKLKEIELLKQVQHKNIVSYKDSGAFLFEDIKFSYLVLGFIIGETLEERLMREKINTYIEIRQIISDVLEGLNYLHNLPKPVIHNEITPQNIMLDLSGDTLKAIIIDFGLASYTNQKDQTAPTADMNLNYVSSECFNGLFSPQSDIFSVGAVFYELLYGSPPWYKEISKHFTDRTKAELTVLTERKKPLLFPNDTRILGFDEGANLILKRALSCNLQERFQNVKQFINSLNGITVEEEIQENTKEKNATVFISYSTVDKEYADLVCDFLEKNNITCWIAPRDIVAGEEYGESIVDAISNCKMMVVIFTSNANKSKFVNKEVERGVTKGVRIIPVRFEDVFPNKSLEFFISSMHWIDAITPPYEKHLNELSSAIEKHLQSQKNIV